MNDDIHSQEVYDSTFARGLSIELQYISKQEHIVPDLLSCLLDIYEGLQAVTHSPQFTFDQKNNKYATLVLTRS